MSQALRTNVVGAISSLEQSGGGFLAAGPAGLGSEVELVLASVGILMYNDVSLLFVVLLPTWLFKSLFPVHHCRFRLYSAIRKSCGGAIRHNGGPATLLMLSSGHHYGTELDYRRLLVYLSGTDIFCMLPCSVKESEG